MNRKSLNRKVIKCTIKILKLKRVLNNASLTFPFHTCVWNLNNLPDCSHCPSQPTLLHPPASKHVRSGVGTSGQLLVFQNSNISEWPKPHFSIWHHHSALTKAWKSTFTINKVYNIKPVKNSISMTNWFLKILVSEEPSLVKIKNKYFTNITKNFKTSIIF